MEDVLQSSKEKKKTVIFIQLIYLWKLTPSKHRFVHCFCPIELQAKTSSDSCIIAGCPFGWSFDPLINCPDMKTAQRHGDNSIFVTLSGIGVIVLNVMFFNWNFEANVLSIAGCDVTQENAIVMISNPVIFVAGNLKKNKKISFAYFFVWISYPFWTFGV